MTPRERLVAATRGGPVDQQPTLGWPGPVPHDTDAVVMPPIAELLQQQLSISDRLVLAEIASPFQLLRGKKIGERLEQAPSEGEAMIAEAAQRVRTAIARSLDAGADGILYCLIGAAPDHLSPMMYGGHFLELDRDLLLECRDARLNVLFVSGAQGAYLDVVSDLPAEVFAWDAEATGVSVEDMRKSRIGGLASTEPQSDILLVTDVPKISMYLENHTFAA